MKWRVAIRASIIASGLVGCSSETGRLSSPPSPGDIAPPMLLSPRSLGVVATRLPTFRWSAVAGATGVRIELCLDRGCSQRYFVAYSTSTSYVPGVASPTEQFELPALATFWRVQSMVGNVFGPWGEVWELVVPHRDTGSQCARGTVFDVNGDGLADMVAVAQVNASAIVSTVLGQAPPQPFGPRPISRSDLLMSLATVSIPRPVALGDTDGDGLADYAVVGLDVPDGDAGATIASDVRLSGHPTFAPPWNLPTWVDAEAAGDLNADGFGDVVFSGASPGVALGGTSASPFALGELFSATYGTSAATASAYIVGRPGDYNGDGLPDLAFVPGNSPASVYIHPGHPDGTLPDPIPAVEIQHLRGAASDGSNVAAPADVNGDGYEDLVTAPLSTEVRQIEVYLGGPQGIDTSPDALFTLAARPGVDPASEAVVFVAGVGDVNGDGYPDIAMLLSASTVADRVVVLPGSAMGLSSTPLYDALAGSLGATSIPDVAGTGDSDGDGIDDLSLATITSSGIAWLWMAKGAATLVPTMVAQISPSGQTATSVALIHSE